MRDALADYPDDDLDLPAVVRRKSPGKPQKRPARPQRRPGAAERAASFLAGHPRQILAALFLTGCGGAIAWNALVLQNTRHPAPLFNQREIVLAPEAAPVEAAPEQPLPPTRPEAHRIEAQETAPSQHPAIQPSGPVAAEPGPAISTPKAPARSALTEAIRNGGQPVQAAQPAKPAPPAPPAARTAPAHDPIADIIRMGGPVPMPPANVSHPEGNNLVVAGQRALALLGYNVKVDGVMGAGTRQAIERFEKERRLPVTGEFGARTVRELTAMSGIAIQ